MQKLIRSTRLLIAVSLRFSTAHDRVAVVGPEISVTFPMPMLFVSFR